MTTTDQATEIAYATVNPFTGEELQRLRQSQ
jgi:hypothetical protein